MFLCCEPEQNAVEWTVDSTVIWDAMTLMLRHDDVNYFIQDKCS